MLEFHETNIALLSLRAPYMTYVVYFLFSPHECSRQQHLVKLNTQNDQVQNGFHFRWNEYTIMGRRRVSSMCSCVINKHCFTCPVHASKLLDWSQQTWHSRVPWKIILLLENNVQHFCMVGTNEEMVYQICWYSSNWQAWPSQSHHEAVFIYWTWLDLLPRHVRIYF